MCMEYRKYVNEIKEYCDGNCLDFSKLKKMVKGCGAEDIIFQYHDPEKGKNGLLDETPMPVVLWVKRINGKLVFEQTEHTKRYLV